MDKLQSHINEHSAEFGSIPFWSWNDKLNQQKLIEQIDSMHENGIGGFFMHFRDGLETEYLGKKLHCRFSFRDLLINWRKK